MRVLKVPETGAKKILLDAAEKLVVEKGFDLVSIRDVTGAAKANVAAVNYHFGSREGLLDIVTLRILAPLNEERTKALEKRAGKTIIIEEIVSAFVKPLLTTISRLDMELGFFLILAGRILTQPDGNLLPELAEERSSVTGKFLGALARTLPKHSPEELEASWRIFDAGLSQALLGFKPGENPSELMDQWIAFAVRGFGSASSVPEVPKDDKQGMLFDF